MELLRGKVAIVTGAGRGIGAEIARDLAHHGARVVVNDIGVSVEGYPEDESLAEAVAAEIGPEGAAIASTEDVSNYGGADRLVEATLEAYGRIDILVNNAGTLRVKPLCDLLEEDWDEVIRTHLKHTFAMTQHVCRYWRDEAAAGRPPRGRVINSVAATGLVGRPDMGSNHAAAKGAIAAFTLAVAHEMFPLGVTVNAVCPAAVRTRMATHLNIEHPEPEEGFDPASPGNLAPLVTYLCSDRADWVTGQVFRMVGGLLGLYQPWSIVARAEHEGRWTVEELDVAVRRLFGNYPGVVREPVEPYGKSPVASRPTGPHPMAHVRR